MKKFLNTNITTREEMGKKARKKMEKEFDKNSIVKQTIAALDLN